MKTKYIEAKLKTINIKEFDDRDLILFAFTRKSFYRDYSNLHLKTEEQVQEIFQIVIWNIGIEQIKKDIYLCYDAAIQSSKRHTYYFNIYLISLLELYFDEIEFKYSALELKEDTIVLEEDTSNISYEWVLFSKILTPYYRYLLFEYLALGYNIPELAERRYCDVRTIYNHLNIILEDLS